MSTPSNTPSSRRELTASPLINRSQAILRMPVDMICASMVLHDGERSDVMLFVPSGEAIGRLLRETEPFVAVVRKGRTCYVSRSAIACLGIARATIADEDALPVEHQKVSVKLRSGTVLDGTLSWCAGGEQRTKAYLDGEDCYFELHTDATTYYVLKAHVATVQEC